MSMNTDIVATFGTVVLILTLSIIYGGDTCVCNEMWTRIITLLMFVLGIFCMMISYVFKDGGEEVR